MADVWDSPPTEAELGATGGTWDSPPTDGEIAAHAGPSGDEAAFRGAAQGVTLGHGDEIAGGIGAALTQGYRKLLDSDAVKLGPAALAEGAQPVQGPSYEDDYLAIRDRERGANAAAKNAHGYLYGAGQVAGAVPLALAAAPLLPAVAGEGVGALALNGAIQGGAMGAVQGAGESNSARVKDIAKDALVGGGTGFALGGALPLALAEGKYLGTSALQKVAPRLAEKLKGLSTVAGRRALTNGANKLAPTKALTDDVVNNAVENGRVGYFDSIEGIANKLKDAEDNIVGPRLSEIKQKLASQGIDGANAPELIQSLREQAQQVARNSASSGAADEYNAVADHLEKLLQRGELEGVEANNLGLNQAEKIKSDAQAEAAAEYRKVNGSSPVGNAKKDIAAQFRQANEDAIENQLAARAENIGERTVPGRGHQVAPEDPTKLSDEFKSAKKAFGMNASAKDVAEAAAERARGGGLLSLKSMVLAGGNPAKAFLLKQAQNRAYSTVAAGANDLSRGLGKLGQLVSTDPAQLGKYGNVLSRAAARGGSSLAVTNFLLSGSDPQYQEMKKRLDKDEAPTDPEQVP